MRYRFLALIAAAAGALAALGPARAADEPFQLLEVEQVADLLGAPDVRVFDANTPETYAKAHLPGAKHVELSQVAQALPADRSLRLVFYCKNPH